MQDIYPSVLDRVKSTTIDMIIMIALMFLVSEILGLFDNVETWIRIVLFVLIWMYEPLCTAFGATIGNDKMEIRIRKVSDPEKRINLLQAILRFMFKFGLGWISFIGIFISKRKRAIHDVLSGSIVVQA